MKDNICDTLKNYCVTDYKFDYLHNLRTIVIPYLKKYEIQRRCLLILAIFLIITFEVAIYFALYYAVQIHHLALLLKPFRVYIISFIFGAPFVIWKMVQAYFEYKLKGEIMPTMIKALPGFEWDFEPDEEIEQSVINSHIFYYSKKYKQFYSDIFFGSYRDVKMDFSGAYYQVKKFPTMFEFNGSVIRIKMNKSFEGVTILRPNTMLDNDCSDLEKAGLQKIELEDIEFNKKFLVYSTDQIEARYLLTTGFMDRFKQIAKAYKSSRIFCSFYDNYIYIAPYTKGDPFSLFGLTKSLTDLRPYNMLFEHVASVLSMVDYLKLDKNLG